MARPTKDEQTRKQRELSDKQLAFAVWLATPPHLRQPATKDELALVLGSNRQTLWRWEKDPRVIDAARFVVLQNAGDPDRVVQVLDMLYDVALSKRDAKVAETWLKAVGVMQAHSQRDMALWDHVSEDALDSLSDEALLALKAAKELEIQERERIQAAKEKLGS